MNCRDFVEFLLGYLEGELPAAQREVFEAHLQGCTPCEDYLDSYSETIRLGKACCDEEGPVPDEAPEALIQAILAARRQGEGGS